ncbi:hypothetical protein DEO72_LG8g2306 [Vigna unguiculata]|uniref:Uncharacterized protein n=1 Tax=Vigna unguiculata TaxID=3917 RepID=A0A4D6MUI0_VIGUN|nr:hypothetical protein DEO72_LG8g2306 [Vigna unguiculata]
MTHSYTLFSSSESVPRSCLCSIVWVSRCRTVGGTCYFCPSELISPKRDLQVLAQEFPLEYSPRRVDCVLSESPSRSGEMVSPKRAFAKLPGSLTQSRLSESLLLERGHSPCLSEGLWLERDPLWGALFFSVWWL